MWGQDAAGGLDSWVDMDAQRRLESCLAALDDLLYDDKVDAGTTNLEPQTLDDSKLRNCRPRTVSTGPETVKKNSSRTR